MKSTSTFQPKLLLDTAPHPHTHFTSETPTQCSPSRSKRCEWVCTTIFIWPKYFQVLFQQPLHQLCMGGRDAKLSLRDQTGVSPHHRGAFSDGKWEKGQTKAKLWSQIWGTELQIRVACGIWPLWHWFSHTEVFSLLINNFLGFFVLICLSLLVTFLFFSFSSQKTWQTKAIGAIKAPTGEKPLSGAAERRILYPARCRWFGTQIPGLQHFALPSAGPEPQGNQSLSVWWQEGTQNWGQSVLVGANVQRWGAASWDVWFR